MTTSPYCTVCRENPLTGTRATFTVCQACVDWIDQHLDQVEQLWPQLPDFLERGRGHSGPRVSGATQTSGGLPPAEHVLNLIGPGGAHDRLSRHDVAIRTARGLAAAPATGSADHRMNTALRNLRNHLGWATANLDLHAFTVDLQQLAGAMRTATGDRDEPTTTELGAPCPALDDTTECGAVLRYDKTTRAVRCDSGHHLNTAWHLRLATA